MTDAKSWVVYTELIKLLHKLFHERGSSSKLVYLGDKDTLNLPLLTAFLISVSFNKHTSVQEVVEEANPQTQLSETMEPSGTEEKVLMK